MIKVLHILDGLKTGGAESFVINLQKAFEREDVQFDFLLRNSNNDLEKIQFFNRYNSRIFITSSWPKKIISNYRETKSFFLEKINNYNYIHIHANALIYMLPIFLAKKYFKGTIIVHSHNTRTSASWMKIVHYFNKIILNHYKVYKLACSESAGRWMFGKNFQIIPNSIDVERFKLANNSMMPQSKNMITLVSVGRLEEQKNYFFIIPIIKKLKDEGIIVKYFIAGEGRLKKALEKTIIDNNLQENIILMGNVSDVGAVLCKAQIFLMPSLYEGFGIALLEAQSTGISCIVSSNVAKESCICKNVYRLALVESEWYSCIKKIMNIDGYGFDESNNTLIANSQYGLNGLKTAMRMVYGCK